MNKELQEDISTVTVENLSDETVRRKLGPAGWKAFHRITEHWGISAEDARQLVALLPGTDLKDVDSQCLGEVQLTRIGILVGIYKALHALYRNPLADRWIMRPNDNHIFGGTTPLAYMVDGGISALRNVRKLLTAKCAGN